MHKTGTSNNLNRNDPKFKFVSSVICIHMTNYLFTCFRRLRRIMKSPDPLEEQRRKELQQGELGTGGVFG